MTSALKLIAALLLALTLVSACGGGGRPSVEEISDGISENSADFGDVDDDAATCIAEALEGSDVSDEALQALVDGDEDFEPKDGDEEALQSVITNDLAECVPAP